VNLSRRRVIALGAVVAAAGVSAACTDTEPGATGASEPERSPLTTPDLELLALYASVRRTYPELNTQLAALEAQHREHLAALGSSDPDALIDVPVAGTSAAAVEQCMMAERRAADAHQAACLQSSDPTQARLLAILAASEASHVPALAALA
jgi:hypothetical protein